MSTSQKLLTAIQVALILAVGLVGGQALCSMLRPASISIQRSSVGRSLPQMPVALPAEGKWTLGDSPLSVRVEIIGSGELADRMDVPPEVALRTAADTGEGNSNDNHSFDASLFASIKRVCRQVETVGALTTYTLTQPRMKLRVFSTGKAAQERLVGGYLAYPRSPDAWTLVVGTLRTSDPIAPESPHLLPRTDLTCSIATRVSLAGILQCEVVEAYGNLEDVIFAWQNRGWTVDRTEQETLACTHNNRQIRVHVRHDPDEILKHYLLLIDMDALLEIEDSST